MENSIEPIGQRAAPAEADLSDVVDTTTQFADAETAMSRIMTNTIEHMATLPGETVATAGSFSDLTAKNDGLVPHTKSEILSQVERPGTPAVDSLKTDPIEEMSTALQGLMLDLANWNVTWAVAKNTQRDLTHVLKSN